MNLSTAPVHIIEIPTLTQLNELGCTILAYDFMYDMDYNNPRLLDIQSLMGRVNEIDAFEVTEEQRAMVKELRDILTKLPMSGFVILNPLSAD